MPNQHEEVEKVDLWSATSVLEKFTGKTAQLK